MKNFPHQFNDLDKLYKALSVVKQLIDSGTPLTDENFGEQLTRHEIYTYRDRGLSVDEFLEREQEKPTSNRGYLTVSRDIHRFFELLGFVIVFPDKLARLSPAANQLLQAPSMDLQIPLWKNAMLQLGLEGTDGEISHPYRILLRITNVFPGIDTSKLMLALEAENDSEEEFERISNLERKTIDEIIHDTGTTESMAANAVKILPGIAEQLGDIERINNKAYPKGLLLITEDEITTEELQEPTGGARRVSSFRQTSSGDIARDPNLSVISSVSIDLTQAIKIRQKRLVEHQDIVRLLAAHNERYGLELYEGKFDCLATKEDTAMLFEVKTILESFADVEKQTIKGVGHIKYYKFSIVHQQMHYSKIKEIIVFSHKPEMEIIDFCTAEQIFVIWRNNDSFQIFNPENRSVELFNPENLL